MTFPDENEAGKEMNFRSWLTAFVFLVPIGLMAQSPGDGKTLTEPTALSKSLTGLTGLQFACTDGVAEAETPGSPSSGTLWTAPR